MSPKTILIADDDGGMIEALRVRLEREGYTVVLASDAYHALGQAVKFKPDLMLLDIHMPAGEGFSVIERLSALGHGTDIPFLFVTGDPDPRLKQKAEMLGASGILQKPFGTRDLLQQVHAALRPPTPIHGV